MRFSLFVLSLPLLTLLSACSSTNRLLKAGLVEPSPFFEQPWLAQNGGTHLPFQKVWTTPDRKLLAEGLKKRKLYIAPVTLAYLRPMNKSLPSQEVAWGVQRQEAEIALRLREEFVNAFRRSPHPLYRLASKPGADTLTLQLALIELHPTSPKGNAVMTVLKFAVTPIATLGRYFTKGNIAIEGKVTVATTGRAYFQFADNEHDKLTFINTRDFQPYGHAVNTIRDWAVQFETMTRSPRGWRVKDSSSVTLRPN
ncbi:MAG: DUF3313 family protein [Prosthecobacter sp.]|jgi:hypothetical protein|uniref:DUF3313 family protein n=1 Tax=Prosthecobacter sp. TaxID=1965333 RepID=UPI0019E985A4|nr:DUF3313 family protein [Prosthecobacter sp.]MBE2283911.1 DUF3313 family protein [Prosthecobacter sp.]